MESRFSFLPCGRSVQPYRHRRKSPYTAAMCRRRKDKKGDRSKRGGRRRRRRKGKRRWIGPRDASMHRGARGRASEGGRKGRAMGRGGGGWTRRKRVTLHCARRRWASRDDRSLRDRQRETPRPSRFCHVRQVRRPAVAVVVVDSTSSLRNADQPRNRSLARKGKIGSYLRRALFDLIFHRARFNENLLEARDIYKSFLTRVNIFPYSFTILSRDILLFV